MGASIRAQHGILASPIMAVHVAFIIVGHAMVGMTFFISVAYLVALATRAARGENGRQAPAEDSAGDGPGDSLGVIDRCNLIVAQLAAWMVAVGTMLGAYWADFSWGRWWGWDPKEVWALMTALAFVAILHLRLALPPRHRGWATAVLSMLGTGLMLFNWVGVNYFFHGLHSYA